MKTIIFNKYLFLIFTFLLFVLNIYFFNKADLLTRQETLLKSKITDLNKDILRFKPWVTQRNLENFIEGKKVPPSITKNPIYNNYFNKMRTGKISVVLVGTSSDCSSCTEEEIEMWRQFLNYKGINEINRFSIYHNSNEKSYNDFKKKYNDVFPVICDSTLLFKRELNIQRTPSILVVNNQNRIIYAHIPISEDNEKTKNFIEKIERILQ